MRAAAAAIQSRRPSGGPPNRTWCRFSALSSGLIRYTVRWAGFDKSGGMIDNTGGFSVTINLNTKQLGDTVDAEYVEL